MNSPATANKDNVQHLMIQTAYKFYTIKAMSCDINNTQDFILSTTAKATWQDPLITIYKALENKSIATNTSYTITQLLHTINEYDAKLRENLRKN